MCYRHHVSFLEILESVELTSRLSRRCRELQGSSPRYQWEFGERSDIASRLRSRVKHHAQSSPIRSTNVAMWGPSHTKRGARMQFASSSDWPRRCSTLTPSSVKSCANHVFSLSF